MFKKKKEKYFDSGQNLGLGNGLASLLLVISLYQAQALLPLGNLCQGLLRQRLLPGALLE